MNRRFSGLVAQAGWAGVAHASGLVLRYLMFVVVGRALGPQGLGVYTLAVVITVTAAAITRVGFDQTAVRYIAAYTATSDGQHRDGLLAFLTVIGGLCSVLVAVILWSFRNVLAATLNEPSLSSIALWVGIGIPFLAIGQIWRGAIRGTGAVVSSASIEQVGGPLFTLVFFIGLRVGFGPTISGAVQATVLAHLATTLVGGFVLMKRLKSFHRPMAFDPRPWLRYSIPMALDSGVSSLRVAAPALLLGALASSEVVGLFAPPSRLASVVTLPLVASIAVFAPEVSAKHTVGETAKLQSPLRRLSLLSAALTVLMAGAIALFGRTLLNLFGDPFVVAYVPLLILLGAETVNAATGPTGVTLSMTGRQWWKLFNGLVGIVVIVTSSALLIPSHSVVGAAISVLLSAIAVQALQIVEVRSLLGLSPYDRYSIAEAKAYVRNVRKQGSA